MTHRYPPSSSTSGEHINYELSQELLDELNQPSGPYNSSDFLDTYSQYFVDPRLLLGSGERPSTPLGSISVFGNRPGIMDSHPSSGADTPPSEHEELSISSASSSKQPSSNTTPATTRSSSYASVENIMPSLLVPAPIHLVRTRRPGLNSSSSSSTSRLGHKSKSKEGKSRSSRSADAVSSSSTLLRRRASSPSAASTAEYYSSADRSLKLRIPKRLPAPQFRFSTNPHVDVVRHLRRIGLEQHAETAQQDQWLAVYVRDRIRQMTTSSCWRIAAQTSGPDTDTCGALASVHVVQSDSGSQSSPPSHVLALLPCGSERSGGTASQQAGSSSLSSSSAAGHGMAHSAPILLPVHALIYGVQCYHIPDGYFHSSRMMIDEDTVSHDGAISVPVLRLHLPHPATFSITHEYLYSGSPQKLLINLIPVRLLARGSHVAGSWTAAHNAHQTPKRTGKQRSKLSDGSIKASDLVPEINTMPKREPQASSSSSKTSSTCKREEEEAAQDTDRLPDTSKLNVQEQMVQALSFLPTSRLIDITVLIHSVWLNGAAVGLADRDYWNTLACAWDYVYQALALAQKRAKYCEDRKLPADLDLSRLNVASGV
ncbi:hypothetical protein OC845_002514 [Tilletia horrida]|nr:hypothetical protein OC845_002514 [Tilletia horrida]